MADFEDFLKSMGHETAVFDLGLFMGLEATERSVHVAANAAKMISDFLPDFVIGYGATAVVGLYSANEQKKVDLFTYLGIPSVCIHYDDPLDKRIFEICYDAFDIENHYFFVWDRHYVGELKKLGYDKSYFMPIASNIRRFKKLKSDEEDRKKFGADVSFVGSYTIKREMILKALLDRFDLKIWGYEWEKARDPRFKNCIMGIADNEKDLAKVYNYSKININITVDQGIGSLNMRVFDCMASGGFLISDYKSDFEELFDIEKETVTFKTLDELPGLVDYYLNNEEKRKEIARNARKKVLAEHSYMNRINFILETLEGEGAFMEPRWWKRGNGPGEFLNSIMNMAVRYSKQKELECANGAKV